MLFNFMRDLKSPILRRLVALLILLLVPYIFVIAWIVGVVAAIADLFIEGCKFTVEVIQSLKDPVRALVSTIKTGEKPL